MRRSGATIHVYQAEYFLIANNKSDAWRKGVSIADFLMTSLWKCERKEVFVKPSIPNNCLPAGQWIYKVFHLRTGKFSWYAK